MHVPPLFCVELELLLLEEEFRPPAVVEDDDEDVGVTAAAAAPEGGGDCCWMVRELPMTGGLMMRPLEPLPVPVVTFAPLLPPVLITTTP